MFPKPSEAVLDVEGVINENAGAAGLAAPNSEVDAVEGAAPNSVEEELAGAPKREGGAADVVVEPKVGADAWVPKPPNVGGLAAAVEVAPKGAAAKVGAVEVVAVPNVSPPTAGAAVPVGLLPKLNI